MKKEDAIKFCETLLAYLKGPDHAQILALEERLIKDESRMDLKLIDGAMKTVGDTKVVGIAFELRANIWLKEER